MTYIAIYVIGLFACWIYVGFAERDGTKYQKDRAILQEAIFAVIWPLILITMIIGYTAYILIRFGQWLKRSK